MAQCLVMCHDFLWLFLPSLSQLNYAHSRVYFSSLSYCYCGKFKMALHVTVTLNMTLLHQSTGKCSQAPCLA
jgi:hypothetical protein